MSKANAGGQKEGAKGSFAAAKVSLELQLLLTLRCCPSHQTRSIHVTLQDNISAAAGHAKEKMSSKGDKNKAQAQTSAYNTRSKAANKLDPST